MFTLNNSQWQLPIATVIHISSMDWWIKAAKMEIETNENEL